MIHRPMAPPVLHRNVLSGKRHDAMFPVGLCLIDTSKPVWTYCPKHHKTAHKGKKRVIVIGPQAQQVLNSLRELSRSDYVFDPQAGLEEFLRKAYGENARVRKTIGECYSKHSLNAAVRKACDRAGIQPWSPGQSDEFPTTSKEFYRLDQSSFLESVEQLINALWWILKIRTLLSCGFADRV